MKTKVTSKGHPSKKEKSSNNGETQGKVPVMWMFCELGTVNETSSCAYQTRQLPPNLQTSPASQNVKSNIKSILKTIGNRNLNLKIAMKSKLHFFSCNGQTSHVCKLLSGLCIKYFRLKLRKLKKAKTPVHVAL